MSVHTPTEQVVIVHGPANPDLDAALELAGMAPVITLAHLTIWARTNGPAGSPARAGIPPQVDAGPERLLLTVPQAAAALGIGRTMTYQLIRDGAIDCIHVGRCTRIPADTLPHAIARLRARQAAGPSRRSRPVGRIGRVGAHDESQLCAARTA